MRRIAIWVLALFASGFACAAVPRLKPLNPKFLDGRRRQMELMTNETARTSGLEDAGGLSPGPLDLSHLGEAYRSYRARRKTSGPRLLRLGAPELPTKWDSRDVGGANWVTPVGNQVIGGPCWAFAAVTCLETALIKGGIGTYDLSENHFAAHEGFLWPVTYGGNINMATALTARWTDPLLESQDPYQQGAVSTNGAPQFHVQDAEWIPARADGTDNAELKRAVMEYGAVMIGYYSTSSCYNLKTGAYYYDGAADPNHGVAVVGWDDDYAVSNFSATRRPSSPGAFLIKNSWGVDAASTTNGYTWISYCDTVFANTESLAFACPEPTNNYGRVYQYDPCGLVSAYGTGGSETVWGANLFTASATGVVDAVGFYAMSPGTSYEISVYTNCAANRPRSGACARRATGETSVAGYLTVRLPAGVALETPGGRFSVVLKLTSPGTTYPLAVEYEGGGYCAATALPGESFVSDDGSVWDDMQEVDPTANACIKAYTRFGSDGRELRPPSTLYVDAESRVPEPDGTLEKPFATIGSAIGASMPGDVVLVAPGLYAECVSAPAYDVTIRSTEGPAGTVIDADFAGSCFRGPSTSRLEGFTLRNGAAEYGGGVCGGVASNCVIFGCQANYGGGASAASLTGCTVYGNVAWESGGGVDGDTVCEGCIVYFNYCDTTPLYDNWESYRVAPWSSRASRLTRSCSFPSGFENAGGSITNDPALVNWELDDWRLRAGSPCLGTGTGGANMGAYQGAGLEGRRIDVMRRGKGEVVPSSAFVPSGETVTFAATSPYHVFAGFETNGVFTTAEPTFTWTGQGEDGVLTAIFHPTNFYVSAARPDDAGDGLDWATARQTLQSAVADAGEGDWIFVAPGVYGPILTDEPGMTLLATGGVAVTAIDAKGASRCAETWSNGVLLQGFALRNGVAPGGYGGGIYGGTLVNCVVSNCQAEAGGGASYAYLTNCLVVGNRAGYYGGGLFDCEPANCTVADNHAGWYGGGAFLEDGYRAVNTSFATNVCAYGRENGNDVYDMGSHTMVNCLFDRDARYADSAHGDYRLAANSPCLDAGRSDLADLTLADLAGTNRLIGGAVDIGCYEYAHVPPGWPDPGLVSGEAQEVQSAKIAASLVAAGFSPSVATKVTTYAGYAALTGWAEARGIAPETLAQAPTALLSPALWAETIVDLRPDDVRLETFEAAGGAYRICLSLDACDVSRANRDLLKAATGVVGADRPDGVFSDRGLSVSAELQAGRLVFTVSPPPEAARYFFKAAVR